ncbi:unnamed protein product, partial [Mesorhabditis spiculigera]
MTDLESLSEKAPLLQKEAKEKKKKCKKFCLCCKKRRVDEYYQQQSELIEAYRKDDKEIASPDATAKKEDDEIIATILTGGASLSIVSTLLESVVDITGGAVLWYASHSIVHTDYRLYPRGRSKLENLSIVIIGIVMGMANFYIIFGSVQSVLDQATSPGLDLITLGLMVATIILKLIMWIVCYRRGTTSSKVLAIDQRNDVLTVSVAIIGATTSKYWKYADPLAASLIATYVAFSWIMVVLEQFPRVSGRVCTPEEYSRVARICVEHSQHIKGLDTLLVYHTGERLLVEVHVVVDPDLTCRVVHDEVVSPLQHKLEKMSIVERAFVHADHEFDGYAP